MLIFEQVCFKPPNKTVISEEKYRTEILGVLDSLRTVLEEVLTRKHGQIFSQMPGLKHVLSQPLQPIRERVRLQNSTPDQAGEALSSSSSSWTSFFSDR